MGTIHRSKLIVVISTVCKKAAINPAVLLNNLEDIKKKDYNYSPITIEDILSD